MVRGLLIRGMLAGLVAGLLMFGVGRLLGESSVEQAIAFEAAHTAGHGAAHGPTHGASEEPELVSRATQAGWGLLVAVTVYGTAFGGLFALVFAVANGRAAAPEPRSMAALLALAGFVAVFLVPGLKYPANPPAVGAAETIGQRTALFLLMLGVSAAAAVLAAVLRRRLLVRHGAWTASLAGLALYGLAVLAAGLLLPAVDEVPHGFPAGLLWRFRMASLAMGVVMWATLGLLFGWLAERLLTVPAPGQGWAKPATPA